MNTMTIDSPKDRGQATDNETTCQLRRYCHGLPSLSARLEPWMVELFSKQKLAELVEEYGSPLNLISTEPMARNIDEFKQVASERELDFQIYFARKANKCLAFVDQAIESGIGIDTASEDELLQAIERGAKPAEMICTAAIKSESLVRTCVSKGVCIAVDNSDELNLVSKVAAEFGCLAEIALRLGGFTHDGVKLTTRFGFDVDCDRALIMSLFKLPVQVTGIHFHLDGYDYSQRVSAISGALSWIELLREQGHNPKFLDIGGGVPMSYLDDEKQWEEFWQSLFDSLSERRDPITYRNHGLGFYAVDEEISGQRKTYPFFQSLIKADWLAKILDESIGEETIADRLKNEKLELRCEPGRSLLDGCGMTLASVEFRKQNADGEWLIGTSMNRTQCRTSSDDFLIDPILVPTTQSRECNMRGYLVGAYCTESELLSLRKLQFPYGVCRGDLIAYPNTAGYFMHFLESRSHQLPLAKNLVVTDGEFEVDLVDQ